jgi:hypothetical protein
VNQDWLKNNLRRSQEKRESNATVLEVLTAEQEWEKKKRERLSGWQSCQTGLGETDPKTI